MQIVIDGREKELLECLKTLSTEFDGIDIISKELQIGDIMIQKDDIVYIVIERKTTLDLAASIKDGRYKEQSLRLTSLNIHTHNIYYLIEGDISSYKSATMKPSTLYSTLFSIQFYKGFSLFRTKNVFESAVFLYNSAKKVIRENFRKGKYKDKEHTENEIETNYTSVIKTCKKDNITPININEIMLSQIPGISINVASKILNEFQSVYNLTHCLKQNSECLKLFTYENDKKQTKKLNKTCIENINRYLFMTTH
jgi:ERCC4-type nuclease